MRDPRLRKRSAEVVFDESLIPKNKCTQHRGRLRIKVAGEKYSKVSPQLLDSMLDRVSGGSDLLDSSIIPEEGCEINVMTRKITLVIKAAGSVEISWRTELKGNSEYITVMPRSEKGTNC